MHSYEVKCNYKNSIQIQQVECDIVASLKYLLHCVNEMVIETISCRCTSHWVEGAKNNKGATFSTWTQECYTSFMDLINEQ